MAPTPIPPKKNTSSLVSPGLSIALIAALLLLTFLVGLGMGIATGLWAGNRTGGSGWAAIGQSEAGATLSPQMDVFWETMDLLYKDFFGEIPSSEELTTGAINGALSKLDDLNTSYMPPKEAEFFSTRIQGSFEGIGARIDWDDEKNAVRIVEPFENQPAWNSGIRRDDIITAVDGQELAELNLTDAILMIRGEQGSTVVLTIERADVTEAFDVAVIRDRIQIPAVVHEMIGADEDGSKDIAYIRLNTFSEDATGQVKQAIEDEMANNPRALIFDLRGNSGGLLREAVGVSSLFLEDNTAVLIERFADGSEKSYRAEGSGIAKDIPMVVLVNGGSASASEIVAGAIQDADRAPLIGETTFGKGSVQIPHSLSNDGILRVTIARWFTPNDRTIDGEGLTPDIEVIVTEEDFETEHDPQLERAIEHFN